MIYGHVGESLIKSEKRVYSQLLENIYVVLCLLFSTTHGQDRKTKHAQMSKIEKKTISP